MHIYIHIYFHIHIHIHGYMHFYLSTFPSFTLLNIVDKLQHSPPTTCQTRGTVSEMRTAYFVLVFVSFLTL
jgi:hypothetical protein